MICRLKAAPLLAAIILAPPGCGQAAPDTAPMEQAQAALTRGDGYTAEIRLRELLDNGADRAALAAYLGQAELQQGNLPEARYWLEPGEFSDATRGLGFLTLGRLEMRAGNLPAAGQAFDRAYQSIPDDPGLWADIGRLRYVGGEQVQAAEASIRAVELGPTHPRALQFRAQLVRDAEGMQAALPWYKRAVAANPGDQELLSDYAATLGEAGRANDMLKVVRLVAKREPGNRQIHYQQAVLAARGGNFALARILLTRSGAVEQSMPAAVLLSGIIDLQQDNAGSAAQTFGRLGAMQPENRRVDLLLARALDRAGSHIELIDLFEEDAKLHNASPYLLTLVGRAHEALGQRDRAAEFLDRAAQERSSKLIALQGEMALGVLRNRGELAPDETLALIRNLILENQRSQAVGAANAFMQKHRGSADAMVLYGDTLLAREQLGEALTAYRSSAAIRRPWPLTRKIVYVLNAEGRAGEARDVLAAHLAGEPFNAEAANLLARAELAAGNPGGAALLADHALRLGGSRDPFLLALRAQIALRAGTADDARIERLSRRAHAIQPLNAAAGQTLKLVQAARRDNPRRAAAR